MSYQILKDQDGKPVVLLDPSIKVVVPKNAKRYRIEIKDGVIVAKTPIVAKPEPAPIAHNDEEERGARHRARESHWAASNETSRASGKARLKIGNNKQKYRYTKPQKKSKRHRKPFSQFTVLNPFAATFCRVATQRALSMQAVIMN